jgi:hypothetical protein
VSDPSGQPDPEHIPDLTAVPRRRSTPRPGSRRARRAEAALARAEAAARARGGDGAALAVVVAEGRPHVRFGLVWAAVTAAAAVGGRGWLAVWLAAAAAPAARQVARARRRAGARPLGGLATLLGASLPLAAVAGPGALAAACAAGVIVVLAARLALVGETLGRPVEDVAATLVAALPVGLAAAAPVLVRGLGTTEALFLLALVSAHDAGSFLAGAGAASRWEGPLTGVACTLPVTLAVAALASDTFGGASPWVLGATAAATAPVGPLLAGALVSPGRPRAAALRRLDSLLVTGPVWAWAAVGLAR